MPRNVLDFKDHPYYALERHLKRNEVIHPKTEVGKVATGKLASGGGSKNLEPIYRRRDVHRVRGVNGWYRLGRDIKVGFLDLRYGVVSLLTIHSLVSNLSNIRFDAREVDR